MKYYELTNGSFNGEKFRLFLKNFMDNLKNDAMDNCYFIMDNVRFHKMKIVQDLILDYGHNILYLPPYSPFLNPIENVFSKQKNYVRKEKCNDESDLFIKIKDGLNLISQNDCDGYWRNMLRYLRKAANEEIIEN